MSYNEGYHYPKGMFKMSIDYDMIQKVTEKAASEWEKNLSVEDTLHLAVIIKKAQADAIVNYSKGILQGAGLGTAIGAGLVASVAGTKYAAKKIKEHKSKKEEETDN